jgi:glycosyltransferase involved in cell wall biosynthesis
MIQAADFGSPYAGSFIPMLRTALLEASHRGWRPHLVLPARARDRDWLAALPEEDLEVSFAPDEGRGSLGRWLTELVEADPAPTVLHTHFSVFDLPAAGVARRNPHVKTFWHIHTRLSAELLVRVRNRVRLSYYTRWVERLLCVAPHLVEGVRARGAPAEKVELFPNALDVDAFSPVSAEERRAARERLSLPPDAIVLLHHGRDWHLKGGDLLLRSLQILREREGRDVVTASVRGGEPAREMAQDLGLGDSAVALEGTSDIQGLYAAADLLMATSRAEGMPLAVLEGLASGLPVVASDIPGHALPVEELPGMRVAALEPPALAAAAEALLERDPASARRDADTARAWIRANLSLEGWARRLLDLFEGALPRSSP